MADEADNAPEIDDEDVLELTDEVQPGAEDDTAPDEEDEAEEIVAFDDGETDPQEGDSGLVKHLREEIKRARAEAAEARKSAPKPQPVEVGEKPTIEDCEYDQDVFEKEYEAWKERKEAAESQAAQQTQTTEEQQKAIAERLEKVVEQKAALGPKADTAFDNVKAVLGEERAVAIMQIADTPEAAAKLLFALGNNPDRLTALADETDPVRFVKAVARLEGQVKTVKRRKVIDPDVPERGSAAVSAAPGGIQKRLAKLKAKAEETGEYSEYLELKRQVKA